MGYLRHKAIVAVVPLWLRKDNSTEHPYPGEPDVEAFRASLPELWRPLVVGPVDAVVNGSRMYCFLPDGSHEGYCETEEGDKYRKQFRELFAQVDEDGESLIDVVSIIFGGDEPGQGLQPEILVETSSGLYAAAGSHANWRTP